MTTVGWLDRQKSIYNNKIIIFYERYARIHYIDDVIIHVHRYAIVLSDSTTSVREGTCRFTTV